jgi:hypothetical protein
VTEWLCDGLQNHRDGFDSRPYVQLTEIIILNHIETAIIILELRSRVFDQIDDPEPQWDAVLSEMSGKQLLELGAVLQDIRLATPEPEEV